MKYDLIFSEEDKEQIKRDYVYNKLSLKQLMQCYNIRSKSYISKVLAGVMRTGSEASKLAHEKYSNSYKHSEETKQKMRIRRLKYLKEHPENTAWRRANMSYPEKIFQELLVKYGFDKKYLIVREYCVFPYYIDFAFVDLKIAIEIDGSQHLLPERKKKDIKKDKLLIAKGWKVLRIAESEVKNNWAHINNILDKIASDSSSQVFTQVGIVKAPKSRIKATRLPSGRTTKQEQSHINSRKVNRPDKDTLYNLIKTYSFVQVGQMFGVTDNAIRKWCRYYQLPDKRSLL